MSAALPPATSSSAQTVVTLPHWVLLIHNDSRPSTTSERRMALCSGRRPWSTSQRSRERALLLPTSARGRSRRHEATASERAESFAVPLAVLICVMPSSTPRATLQSSPVLKVYRQ